MFFHFLPINWKKKSALLQKHKKKYADILLTPETASVFQMKFTKENTLKAIELGRIECEKHIEEIKNLIK